MWKWLVVLGFACFAVACHDLLGPECSQSHKCRLQIESNTSWSGAFGGVNATSSYNGTGNGWIEYWGEVCYDLQKESDPGSCGPITRRPISVGLKPPLPSA